MLARRLFASALNAPSQGVRTATSWASPSRSPSASLSGNTKPQSTPSSSSPTPSASHRQGSGRSKPSRTPPSVRPRSFRPISATNTFFTSSSPLDISSFLSNLTNPSGRQTQGRRRRHTTSRSIPLPAEPVNISSITQCQHPLPRDYSFTPVPLYPQPLHLHMAFTPSHQPIMANMGTGRYTQPPSRRPPPPFVAFEKPSARSPLSALQRGPMVRDTAPSGMPIITTGPSTPLADHLSVTRALAHPSLHHHLASPPTMGYTSEDPESQFLRMMAEADVKNKLEAEWDFDAVLAKLGEKEAVRNQALKNGSVEDAAGAEAEKAQLAEALEGLTGVLDRLAVSEAAEKKLPSLTLEFKVVQHGEGEVKFMKVQKDGTESAFGEFEVEEVGMGEEMGVMLDSVKRKRKKKISKHKYQKRRKATRAQRKRLGK